ncbi:hypothetical protein AG1IA_03230 [Rhizoctonia solani AG-1 IA]|uniref:Uncharacterized protein n=1 Tax=Thanatephorus cucumeris (strain AG1-IA) TaxID=983506 RepID=L8X276_THACA|nr:hypothetical protein AG1IA_03230 [Rhizoctonia solani AG-1 IA]
MIIADQQPSSPSSKRSFATDLPTTQPGSPSSEYDAPPPAYHPPLPTSPLPQSPSTPIHKNHPYSGKRKFWRVILIGLGVYVVVSATIVTPLLVYRLRGSKSVLPDPIESDEPSKGPKHGDWHERPSRPHWPPPGGAESDSRWDLPHPPGPPPGHEHNHDHDRDRDREHGPGGPPWRGPHGWNPDCGEGPDKQKCHRPPNVPPVDGQIVTCNKWRKPTVEEQLPASDPAPYNSFLKYEMPLDRDIFIRAAGEFRGTDFIWHGLRIFPGKLTAGAFQLVVDEKIEKMEVHVEMRFNEHHSYDHTNVCLMNRDHSNPPAMGVGIYVRTETYFPPDESISFNITLRVPLMHYNYTIDTHLPIFEQKILSRPGVYFERLRLSGAASPMFLESVDAGTVDAKTVYERIRAIGVRAAKKIRLATIDSGALWSNPGHILMIETDSHIAGAVLLEHDGTIKAGDEETPDFSLDAKTGDYHLASTYMRQYTHQINFPHYAGNSPIFLRVMHTERSEPSVLHANLTTNLGEIELIIDPQFEGTFDLVAEQAKSDVEEDAKHTADPSGMGRRRAITMKREREGVVSGSVAWRNLSFRTKEGLGIWHGDKVAQPKVRGGRIRAVTSMKTNTLLLPSGPDMDRVTEERAALFRALGEKEIDSVAERMRKAGGVNA